MTLHGHVNVAFLEDLACVKSNGRSLSGSSFRQWRKLIDSASAHWLLSDKGCVFR